MEDVIKGINAWGQGTVFKYGLIDSFIMMMIFLVTAYILKRCIFHALQKSGKLNSKFVQRLLKTILYTIAIYGCLSLLTPFESVLGKVWGSAGIIAVVIGFAAQESMGNLVNGILISTFKPFKIGDLVKVNNGEFEGYIQDISLRDTVIKTYENTNIIIPNSIMNKAVLENVSTNGSKKGNFLDFSIHYENDLDQAMSIIKEEIIKHPNFMDIRNAEDIAKGCDSVITRLINFDNFSITLRTTIYSIDNAQGYAMLSDLRIAIKKHFDKEGIKLSSPQCIHQVKK